MTNCEKCGAPLHNNKCDYCGADYREIIPIHRIDTYNHKIETIGCNIEIPLEYMEGMNQETIADMVRIDLSRKMSERLARYMDVETWLKPESMTQVFGGRIKIVSPRGDN